MIHSDGGDIEQTAIALLKRHGEGVRQFIVDRMLAAIRSHDLEAAKRWDEIGQAVDCMLAA